MGGRSNALQKVTAVVCNRILSVFAVRSPLVRETKRLSLPYFRFPLPACLTLAHAVFRSLMTTLA